MASCSTVSAWLAQIAASPDDDAPLLVYADALIQEGDPRGELITVQCALAREESTDEPLGDVARLISREHALLKKQPASTSRATSSTTTAPSRSRRASSQGAGPRRTDPARHPDPDPLTHGFSPACVGRDVLSAEVANACRFRAKKNCASGTGAALDGHE
jgi:uncharacterized protein (TIGR02996 family)